jgi:DNA polymerase III delta prime subunit
MTYLIIGRDTKQQQEKILQMVSAYFQKDITAWESLSRYPDIHILDGSEQNSIGIDEVKDFQTEMKYQPFEEEVQIGIIWESQKLTHQAQNSLLKTLEESEDHTIFLLCVNNGKSLLQTIFSRSKPIYLNGIIETEEIDIPDILEKDLVDQFKEIEELSKEKDLALDLVNQIEKYYRQILSKNISDQNSEKANSQKRILTITEDSRNKLNANVNKRMVLENLVLQIKSS